MAGAGQPLNEPQREETIKFTGFLPKRGMLRKTRSKEELRSNAMDEELKIVERILEWAGNRDQAYAWYRNQPIPALGGQTAEAMVKLGQAEVIHNYLDHLAVGGYA